MTNKSPAKQASRGFMCRLPEGSLVGQGLLDFTSGFLELVDSRVTSEQAAGRFGRGICSGAADFFSRFCLDDVAAAASLSFWAINFAATSSASGGRGPSAGYTIYLNLFTKKFIFCG